MRVHKQIKLRLDDFETKTSRFILLKLSIEDTRVLSEQKSLYLGRSPRDRHLWEQVLENDLIVCISFEGARITRYAFQVLGKGIKSPAQSLFPDERPFIVFVELVGTGIQSSIKWEAFF